MVCRIFLGNKLWILATESALSRTGTAAVDLLNTGNRFGIPIGAWPHLR